MGRKMIKHVRDQWAGFLALALVLGGGTAYAVGAVPTSAIDGPLAGTNKVGSKDIIDGQVLTPDLGAGAVTAGKIAAAPEWHNVSAGSTTSDPCAGGATAVFCKRVFVGPNYVPWQNYGSPFSSAGFSKDQIGVVRLKGVVRAAFDFTSDTPESSTIFRLPVGYRPAHQLIFPTIGAANGLDVAAGRITIWPTGEVAFELDCGTTDGDANGARVCSARELDYLSLDGISFRRDG